MFGPALEQFNALKAAFQPGRRLTRDTVVRLAHETKLGTAYIERWAAAVPVYHNTPARMAAFMGGGWAAPEEEIGHHFYSVGWGASTEEVMNAVSNEGGGLVRVRESFVDHSHGVAVHLLDTQTAVSAGAIKAHLERVGLCCVTVETLTNKEETEAAVYYLHALAVWMDGQFAQYSGRPIDGVVPEPVRVLELLEERAELKRRLAALEK